MIPRTIPVLLLRGNGLYKTVKFANEKYVGDPINAVRIFNDKEADEIAMIDIRAAKDGVDPDLDCLRDIASEAFMPLSYGGGVRTCDIVQTLVATGFERVIINTAGVRNPGLISEVVARFGSSTLIGGIDAKRNWRGRYVVCIHGGKEVTKIYASDWAAELSRRGVGEILLTAIDRDGTMSGYDCELIKEVVGCVDVPVIAAGGAASLLDFKAATQVGASAVAAGSLFVFMGKHRAVLISYPNRTELERVWGK